MRAQALQRSFMSMCHGTRSRVDFRKMEIKELKISARDAGKLGRGGRGGARACEEEQALRRQRGGLQNNPSAMGSQGTSVAGNTKRQPRSRGPTKNLRNFYNTCLGACAWSRRGSASAVALQRRWHSRSTQVITEVACSPCRALAKA